MPGRKKVPFGVTSSTSVLSLSLSHPLRQAHTHTHTHTHTHPSALERLTEQWEKREVVTVQLDRWQWDSGMQRVQWRHWEEGVWEDGGGRKRAGRPSRERRLVSWVFKYSEVFARQGRCDRISGSRNSVFAGQSDPTVRSSVWPPRGCLDRGRREEEDKGAWGCL